MSFSLFAKYRRAVAGALIATVTTGCAAVGPTYKRPDMNPPATFRGAEATTAEASLTDMPWWQVFGDPVLQKLLHESIANNLDLRIASARVLESRAVAGIAASYLYPTIGLGFGYSGQQVSRLGEPPLPKDEQPDRRYNNWPLTGSLSWEIDLFGRLRREKEAALARYLATEEGRRSVLITLVGDVSTTYFFIREVQLELEIAHRTVTLNDETVAYYERRLAGGVSNRLEVDQAKANRSVTASTIPDLERQLALAENALSVLLGRPPGIIDQNGPRLTEQMLPPSVPAGLPAKLLERRPDVVQAEQLLVAANADIGAAKALFYPTISLTGTLGSLSGSLIDILRPEALIWSVGAGLLQPIYNAGRIQRNYEAAEARYLGAFAEYQKTALNAYREVADSLVTIQKLAQQRAELEPGVEALRDATQLARSRYDNGLSTYLEVLTADQLLFQQELDLARVIGQQLRAISQLYRSLGGGWQPEPQKAADKSGTGDRQRR
jgi:multidrug efflux system outer membrane protein